VCPACLSEELAWETCTGRGSIYSFTVVHRAPFPGAVVPFVLVIVELEEGHAMLSRLVECSPEEAAIDAPVEVVFVDQSDSISLPCFRLHQGAQPAAR
jgi:uncharacterized OB-fold protein